MKPCPYCSSEIPEGASSCPRCGLLIERSGGSADPHSRLYLAFLVLGGLGVLGIPLVLRTKAYGRTGKAVLITLATVQTLLCFVLLYLFFACFLPWLLEWARQQAR